MARQEKGTRLRGLPPREQLKDLDSVSGSFPTNLRFSNDGRPGNAPSQFNDTRTVNFGRSVTTYYPGVGLNSGSLYLGLSGASDLPLTTTIITTGSNAAAVIDDFNHLSLRETQKLAPFKEVHLFEADAKGLATQNAFFATGSRVSDVGEGFSSPLWSKQKIEIDISVGSSTTLNLQNAAVHGVPVTGSSFPMAYYNFTTKIWEPIGRGYEINAFDEPYETQEHLMIGFGNGLLSAGNSILKARSSGYCLSDFGFPYHPKFHATSSQTLDMKNYISRPFVLEKAVITISGSWSLGTITTALYNQSSRRTITSSINSCFILNQRGNQNFREYKKIPTIGTPFYYTWISASVPTTRILSTGPAVSYRVDTVRDLVGYSQIFSFAASAYDKEISDATFGTSTPAAEMKITPNDVVLVNASSNSGSTGANWAGLVRMSMSMCSPASGFYADDGSSLSNAAYLTGAFMDIVTRYNGGADYDIVLVGNTGYRNGLGIENPSTRGLVGDYFRTPNATSATIPGVAPFTGLLNIPGGKHKTNPYILFPEDRLILGWQIPISANPPQGTTAGANESTFTFMPGTFKMVLYGSYVREGQEENDTLNQLLSTPGIHEVIE